MFALLGDSVVVVGALVTISSCSSSLAVLCSTSSVTAAPEMSLLLISSTGVVDENRLNGLTPVGRILLLEAVGSMALGLPVDL